MSKDPGSAVCRPSLTTSTENRGRYEQEQREEEQLLSTLKSGAFSAASRRFQVKLTYREPTTSFSISCANCSMKKTINYEKSCRLLAVASCCGAAAQSGVSA